jgi:hypothetical protein
MLFDVFCRYHNYVLYQIYITFLSTVCLLGLFCAVQDSVLYCLTLRLYLLRSPLADSRSRLFLYLQRSLAQGRINSI